MADYKQVSVTPETRDKIDAIKDMVEKLQGMRANIVGFVLNDVNVKGVFGYYSHYGHYSKYGKYVYRSGKKQEE